MRKIILLIIFAAICSVMFYAVESNGQIVNNSGSKAADSIPIPFWALDSVGHVLTLGAGDSVGLVIWYPGGTTAYSNVWGYNNAQITAQAIFTTNPMTAYCIKEAVTTIAGGSPKNGVYAYAVVAWDNQGSFWGTPWTGHFQLYKDHDIDSALTLSSDTSLYAGASQFYSYVWTGTTLLDSIAVRLGISQNNHIVTRYHADRDTVFTIRKANPQDTLMKMIFWHISGTPGKHPDSVTIIFGTPAL